MMNDEVSIFVATDFCLSEGLDLIAFLEDSLLYPHWSMQCVPWHIFKSPAPLLEPELPQLPSPPLEPELSQLPSPPLELVHPLVGSCCDFGSAPLITGEIPHMACYDLLVDESGSYIELVSLMRHFARMLQCTDVVVHDRFVRGATLLYEQHGWVFPIVSFGTALQRESFDGDVKLRMGDLCFHMFPAVHTFVNRNHMVLCSTLVEAGAAGSLAFGLIPPQVPLSPDIYVDLTGDFFEVSSLLRYLAKNPHITGHYGVSSDRLGFYLADALHVDMQLRGQTHSTITFHSLMVPLYGYGFALPFNADYGSHHVLDDNDVHHFGAFTQIDSFVSLLKDVPIGGFSAHVARSRCTALEPDISDADEQISWIHNSH